MYHFEAVLAEAVHFHGAPNRCLHGGGRSAVLPFELIEDAPPVARCCAARMPLPLRAALTTSACAGCRPTVARQSFAIARAAPSGTPAEKPLSQAFSAP